MLTQIQPQLTKAPIVSRALNLTGQKIGKLFVIGRTDSPANRRAKSAVWWECTCDCGKGVTFHSHYFNRSQIPSCGCVKIMRGKSRYAKTDSAFRKVMRAYRQSSSVRKYTWGLSDEQARSLFVAPCYYCGSNPTKISKAVSGAEFLYNGIDRTDNSKGYTVENCVTCCAQCNYAKSDLTVDAFREWVRKVYTNWSAAE